ncbi:MAG: ubiquitin-like small modifier protein 1 [Candidatus Promineifilaceae bacterium]|jgi:molybdopterin synthase sulfur carrier subunit
MKVNFYATLRQIVGQKTIELDLPPETTVFQMVESVMDQYPLMRPELVDENGDLHGHIHIFVNGRDAPYLEDKLDTVISASDKIDIFPPVGGG